MSIEKSIFKSINLAEIQLEDFDYLEHVSNIKNELKKHNILLKCSELSGYNNQEYNNAMGDFDDDGWIMAIELKSRYVYFDFKKLRDLSSPKIEDNDIVLIKCWIMESIFASKFDYGEEEIFRGVEVLHSKYNCLFNFILSSSNFSIDFLDDISRLEYFFRNSESEVVTNNKLRGIISYLYYIKDKVNEDRSVIIDEYIIELNNLALNYKTGFRTRQLPSGDDILLFDYYLKKFFQDENYTIELKLYYMPILLWWKITSIIPMRTSEFARMLKREYLIRNGDGYYLKIERVKKKLDYKNKYLPVLENIKLTKELGDIIYKYIEMTDEYGYTETLISYRALHGLRKTLKNLYPNLKSWDKATYTNKVNMDTFTGIILYNLLNDFYDVVINKIYDDKLIEERISPGDTRHFAFTSLMLQDYSQEDMAILGGHRTINALDNYTGAINTYIDLKTVKPFKINKDTYWYINLFKSFPPDPPCNCAKSEINGKYIGYCTADFKSDIFPCESQNCVDCSKWWCSPEEYEFMCLDGNIETKLLPKKNDANKEFDIFHFIFKEAGLKIGDEDADKSCD